MIIEIKDLGRDNVSLLNLKIIENFSNYSHYSSHNDDVSLFFSDDSNRKEVSSFLLGMTDDFFKGEHAKENIRELRRNAYEAAGLTFDRFQELVIEGDTKEIEIYKNKRAAIKEAIK